ncbi:MAG: tetratricopeptide repeat protein [Methylococcales bacterium]|nr:tetratricopeptide repeat protein [Methylococcales bacterium]
MTAVVTAAWIYVEEKLKSVKPLVASAKAANGQQAADNNIGEIEVNFGKENMGIRGDEVATQWFGKAAGHNNVEGQYFYGKALLEGRGITQDFRQAVYWLEKAAHRGYGDAQMALGDMYRMGSGIDIDLERAYLWFNLAASQGIKLAAPARDSMAKLLSPEQLSAMQNEAKRISGEIQRPPQPPAVVGQPK